MQYGGGPGEAGAGHTGLQLGQGALGNTNKRLDVKSNKAACPGGAGERGGEAPRVLGSVGGGAGGGGEDVR